MDYSFKQLKLSDSVGLWLTEILKLDFSKTDVSSLKVKLWERLPEDFDPSKIDTRLVRDNRLTLVGLWHVDPKNPILRYASKTIEIIRDLIWKDSSIKVVKADQIARLVRITERQAEITLMLIYDLGGFFSSASGFTTRYGFQKVEFPQGDSAYDEFLKFESLEKKMEEFFVARDSSANVRNRQFPKGQAMSDSGSSWKQPSSRDTWNDIHNDFGVGKQTFAKKINFVTDKYKRKALFRDIEHAYILAKYGYSKPATILAGSVIEELLRLYLENKHVKPARNSFEGYIKACEEDGILKSAISRLSDSVRHFRNLVHLQKEETHKDQISRATAQSAVASIFIISDDF